MRGQAEDAGGLTPAKDGNGAAWRSDLRIKAPNFLDRQAKEIKCGNS